MQDRLNIKFEISKKEKLISEIYGEGGFKRRARTPVLRTANRSRVKAPRPKYGTPDKSYAGIFERLSPYRKSKKVRRVP